MTFLSYDSNVLKLNENILIVCTFAFVQCKRDDYCRFISDFSVKKKTSVNIICNILSGVNGVSFSALI